MRFFIFLWNTFVVVFSFFAITFAEIALFLVFYDTMVGEGMVWLANILAFIFVIWLLLDIVFRVIIGGGKGIIRYLLTEY